jgi:transcriptional regulator with XRE-family HTH domain
MHSFPGIMPVKLDFAQLAVQSLWIMNERKPKVHAELVNKGFGERLASVRKAKKFSQQELGKVVGLSRGSISNLESGIQNVQLCQVFAFAHALNAPVNEFIPLLHDVVVYEDGDVESDQLFLQVSKRQLVESDPLGDDDENA